MRIAGWQAAEARDAERDAKRKIQQEERVRREQAALADLFPEPWLAAYKECEKMKDHCVRQAWLVARIAAWQWQQAALPRLSVNALTKFAKMVSANRGGDDYKMALKALSSFFDMSEPPKEAMESPINREADLCKRCRQRSGTQRTKGHRQGIYCNVCWNEASEFLDSLE